MENFQSQNNKSKNISRRKFTGLLGGLAFLGGSANAQEENQNLENEKLILEIDKRFGVKIRGSSLNKEDIFSKEDLEGFMEVFGAVERLIGDLKKFSLVVEKQNYIPGSSFTHRNTPLEGYNAAGRVDQRIGESHHIIMAPKKVLDAYDKWELKNNKRPKGEEGRAHDFKWIFPHEMMHAIAVKLGFGYEILASERLDVSQPVRPSKIFDDFIKVEKEVENKIKSLVRDEQGELPNERPESYPTRYSAQGSLGAGQRFERFAECFAYRATGSHYADDDQLFMIRMKFIDHVLAQIKEGKLPVVNEEDYFNHHILGKN